MTLPDRLLASSAEVFTLFVIPIGGGIPAGVILAKNRGLEWPITAFLYFLSDILLAFTFEPLMHGFIKIAKKSSRLSRFAEAYKESMAKTGFKYGMTTGPFALIAISFGVDPMTGRVATRAAGHGFISGWALAICGDMIFFALIMASTLWLNNILGDGTLAAIIVIVAMILIPILIRRLKATRVTNS